MDGKTLQSALPDRGGGFRHREPDPHHSGRRAVTVFERFSHRVTRAVGRPWAFLMALAGVVLWVISGPLVGFGDSWQLWVNTITTIVTFLMVFLIQNTQNRDTEAIQVKLDELIRATQGAHNALLDLEELEEGSLDACRTKYQALASAARAELGRGVQDTGTPEP